MSKKVPGRKQGTKKARKSHPRQEARHNKEQENSTQGVHSIKVSRLCYKSERTANAVGSRSTYGVEGYTDEGTRTYIPSTNYYTLHYSTWYSKLGKQ